LHKQATVAEHNINDRKKKEKEKRKASETLSQFEGTN
jgi:hypothetical protein